MMGLLNFASQVVASGRAFSRRLIDNTIGDKITYHNVTVTSSMELDLIMWLEFLNFHNDVTLFPKRLRVSNIFR